MKQHDQTEWISDHKSILFFIQRNKDKSTFHGYHIEVVTANFGHNLDHWRKVNAMIFLLRGIPVVDHVFNWAECRRDPSQIYELATYLWLLRNVLYSIV